MTTDRLSVVFGALADPTRRAILAHLTKGDATVGELAQPFAMSQPAISQHLTVLERAGLITRRRQATTRLSHLEPTPLREATTWLARNLAYWNESFDRLEALLEAMQGAPDETAAAPPIEQEERVPTNGNDNDHR